MPNELSIAEQLEQHEAIIERGLKTFVEVGNALLAIRDGRLYRAEFATFEDYCKSRWQMQRNYANKLIAAAEVVGNLGTIVPILPTTETQTRPLTKLDPIEQPVIWQRAVETAPDGKVTAAHVEAVVKAYQEENQVIEFCGQPDELEQDSAPIYDQGVDYAQDASLSVHFSSETVEHYTPDPILVLVLAVMGVIDLDPCADPGRHVLANCHYTYADDGLNKRWTGRVFMNPPYGREIGAWVEKLIDEWEAGQVTEAIALVPARVDTVWWNKLTSTEKGYPLVCFVRGRLTFVNNEDPAPFPSALVYLGDNRVEFYTVFSEIGRIWGAWNDELAGLVDYG